MQIINTLEQFTINLSSYSTQLELPHGELMTTQQSQPPRLSPHLAERQNLKHTERICDRVGARPQYSLTYVALPNLADVSSDEDGTADDS